MARWLSGRREYAFWGEEREWEREEGERDGGETIEGGCGWMWVERG